LDDLLINNLGLQDIYIYKKKKRKKKKRNRFEFFIE
jgi:hypothetical protein